MPTELIYSDEAEHCGLRVTGAEDHICVKITWTTRNDREMYGFYYLDYERVVQLVNDLVDWLGEVEDRRCEACRGYR